MKLKIMKAFGFVPFLGLLIIAFAKPCFGDDLSLLRRDYGIGWQYSKPASGLSLRIPVFDDGYLQPIFSFSMKEQDQNLAKHVAFGIRGIYDFPVRYDLKPYAGVAIGYSENDESMVDNQRALKGGSGYEAFFGVEYQKYLLRPALEIGMGGYRLSDQSYYAGVTFNFSLLYYF